MKKINVFCSAKSRHFFDFNFIRKYRLLQLLFLLLLIVLPDKNTLQAQNLNSDGNWHTVSHNGYYQDYIIPNDPRIVDIEFTLKGGDGGYARVRHFFQICIPVIGCATDEKICKSNGGQGATSVIKLRVGTGANMIPHGSRVRFVVGGKGSNGSSGAILGNGLDYGGGGGGTGLLYKTPGSGTWNLLSVAGGGGGAYQGMAFGGCV